MVRLGRKLTPSEKYMAIHEISLTADSDWFSVVIDSPADAVFGKTTKISGSMGDLNVSIKEKELSGNSPQYNQHNFNIVIQLTTQTNAVNLTICHGSNGTVTAKSRIDSVIGVKTNDTDNCQKFQIRLHESNVKPTPIVPKTVPDNPN